MYSVSAGGGDSGVPAPIAAIAGGVQSVLPGGRQPSGVALQTHVELWHDDTQYVNAPWGLFPSPLAPSGKPGKVRAVLTGMHAFS